MRFEVQLVVTELHGGQVLVQVATEPRLAVFALTLDEARLDLALLLGDRIERMHPRLLHRYGSPANVRRERWTLPDALPVWTGAAREVRAMAITCLVSRHKDHDRLWFPRWDLRHWVASRDDVEARGLELLASHLPTRSASALLSLREPASVRLDALTLEVTPAPLAAFTGRHVGRDELPEPALREEQDEERARAPKIATPNLDRLGEDLTERAREDEPPRAVGLDGLVDRLLVDLAKGSAVRVLVGPPGAGKTSVVHELAYRLRQGPRRVVAADATRLIAADSLFSDWRAQTLDVIDEVRQLDAIWYVGPVLPLLDAGKSISSKDSVADVVRPELARRRLTVIGEATPQDWARVELRDPGLARLFAPIRIDEPDEAASLAILRGVAALRRAAVTEPAILAARALAARFGGHASTHAAALALLLRAIEDARAASREAPLDRGAVVDTFCRETGMPPVLIRDDLPLDLDDVRARLEARIVGQPDAIARLVDLVGVIKAGLADPRRPLGSFLFVGPTGVGKTETAKALAALLYGDATRLVRFDMSEMSSPDAVSRFLGFGGRPGKLVSEVRKVPFCVLLLDEIEKAHPSAFDALLGVLGEARLTDEAGRTASFRNVVVVMTSNLGVDTMRASVGFGAGAATGWREHFLAEARRFFRPELFNRIDHVVAFHPLPAEAIRDIADRELAALAAREGFAQRGIALEVPDDVRAWLSARGVDPKLGARPLRRAIDRHLTLPVARALSGVRPSAGHVRAGIEGGAIVPRYTPARRADGGALELRRAVDRVGELRYFVEAAWQGSAVRDLRLEVGRLTRLVSSPRYLAGHRALAAQLSGASAAHALLADAEAFRERVASLEDLAFEAAHARDAEAIGELGRERDEALVVLGELGLRLADRSAEAPGVAVLVGQTRPAARHLWHRTIAAWLAIAARRAWRVEAFLAERRPPAAPRDDGVDEIMAFSSFGPSRQLDEDGSTDLARRMEVALYEDPQTIALRFDGPHAGTMLASEHGIHVLHEVGGGTHRASVVVKSDAAFLGAEHDEASWSALRAAISGRVRRTIHEGRGTLSDSVLALSAALGPRDDRFVERVMIAAVWDEVFFTGAHRAFEGEG